MASTQRQRRTLLVVSVVVILLALLGSCGLWLTRDDGPKGQGDSLAVIDADGHSEVGGSEVGGAEVGSETGTSEVTEPNTGAGTGAGTGTTTGQGRHPGTGSKPGWSSGHAPFAATGHVDTLLPGQPRTLTVTVTNPDRVAYRILQLTATPQDANVRCTAAANLVVGGYDARRPGARTYVVPRRSSITIPLSITLLDTGTSQDACKNVTFPLRYSGTATQGQGKGTS
jgi:hypothetical protein